MPAYGVFVVKVLQARHRNPWPCPPKLRRSFFDRPVLAVAPELIGATLLVNGVGGVIVEVEAYHHTDPAAHSYGGRTQRNAVMFGPPGFAYVYRSYGIHWCLNFVCEEEGSASAVLIRALEPTQGLAVDAAAAGLKRGRARCARGRASCARRLGVTIKHYGLPLDRAPFELRARADHAGNRHRPAHRHHQGGGAALALRAEGLEIPEQAVSRRGSAPAR